MSLRTGLLNSINRGEQSVRDITAQRQELDLPPSSEVESALVGMYLELSNIARTLAELLPE